jgi:hypothetical protein
MPAARVVNVVDERTHRATCSPATSWRGLLPGMAGIGGRAG